MKSIMEQASTIEKAVAKAWERAQHPSSFSIKVLEKPLTNFFGMTTKYAKVALFYSETAPDKVRTSRPSSKPFKEKTTSQKQPVRKKEKKSVEQGEWTVTMIDAAQLWLKTVLKHLNKQDMTFNTLKKNSHLVFLFDKPFCDTPEEERLLFSSFSLLLLKSLRIQFKGTKNIKVVFQQKT